MTGDRPALDEREWAAAERVLADAWGSAVRLATAEVCFGRSHVVRLVAADGRSAILKRARAAGDSLWGGEPDGLAAEWAALEALAGAPGPVAPRLLGGDRRRRLVVMEELPSARTLADSLLGDDADRAAQDLVAYGTALGVLHAAGLADPEAYAAARRRHGVAPGPPWWVRKVDARRGRFAGLARVLAGPAVSGAIDRELDEVVRRLAGTGGRAGLVHGDPCPDNVVMVEGRARVVDFERAAPGAAAMDAAYLRAPFPSCWCFAALPAGTADAATAAYAGARAAGGAPLGEGWDAELAAALAAPFVVAAPALARALGQPAAAGDTGPGLDGSPWGTTTMAPRLATWCAAFLATPAGGDLPALAAVATAARDRLQAQPEGRATPAYPAFPAPGTTPVAAPDDW